MAEIKRPQITVVRKQIKIWKITLDIVRHARDHKPEYDEEMDIETNANRLLEWCVEINNRATTEKTVVVSNNNEKKWYNADLKRMQFHLKLLRGDKKKELRNKYTSAIRAAKWCAEEKIKEANQSRGVWSVVNAGQNNRPQISLVDHEGRETSDPSTVATVLAKHFKDKVDRLKREPDTKEIIECLQEQFRHVHEWDIKEVNTDEVAKFIDALPSKTSSGPDGVSYRFIKILKFELFEFLTKITNASIRTGYFPSRWRIAKVIPVYKKKGKRVDPGSYRPVGLTSCLGKLVENIIKSQLDYNLAEQRILPDELHGFRAGRSTATCLIKVMDTIKKALGEKKKVMLVAIDASAAFDLISRNFLLETLEALGSGPLLLNWLRGYFTERSSYVQVEDKRSEAVETNTGVVQGGPMSPVMYNVGSISLPSCSLETISALFADDGNELAIADTEEECQQKAQEAADKISGWFEAVGLSLNEKKSEVMSFGFTAKPVKVGATEVHPSECIQFLGYQLQDDLKCDKHVEIMCNRIRMAAGRIRCEGRHMRVNERRVLYHGWIQGKLMSNGAVYLPVLNEGQKNDLQTACNAGIRAVIGLPRKGQYPIGQIRQSLGIRSVKQISEFVTQYEGWKMRPTGELHGGPGTRAKGKGDIQIGKYIPWQHRMSQTKFKEGWNQLPVEVRKEVSEKKAKKMIMKNIPL